MDYTQNQKELFFTQYWGQKVKRSYLPEQTSLQIIDYNVFRISHLIINGYLELKSLNDITTDDIFELIKLLCDSDDDINYIVDSINDGLFTMVDIVKPFLDLGHQVAENSINPIKSFWAADYLRSKGYVIPFGGFTLDQMLEFGWFKYATV